MFLTLVLKNTDNSWNVTIPTTADYTLADITHTDTDGSPVSLPAMIPMVCSPGSADTYASAKLMKTGQTTSYVDYDDGYYEAGREIDFFTLKANNPFGNTNRFTDELGGLTYTNNIVIDWSTFDGSSVLGYYRTYLTAASWNNQIDACIALSIATFTNGWRMANINEMMNIHKFVGAGSINYAPFNIDLGGYMWTSTSRDATYAVDILNNIYGGFGIDQQAKSNSYKAVAVRTFTVSGTTLT